MNEGDLNQNRDFDFEIKIMTPPPPLLLAYITTIIALLILQHLTVRTLKLVAQNANINPQCSVLIFALTFTKALLSSTSCMTSFIHYNPARCPFKLNPTNQIVVLLFPILSTSALFNHASTSLFPYYLHNPNREYTTLFTFYANVPSITAIPIHISNSIQTRIE